MGICFSRFWRGPANEGLPSQVWIQLDACFLFIRTQYEMTKMIAQTAAPAAGGFPPSMIIVWLLFIAGFYFLFIAPQRKKQKEHDKMLSTLQSGDEVVTTGGIYGVITNVKDD